MGPGDPLEREAEARLAARLRQGDLAERLALQARALDLAAEGITIG
jgi:hypothetical protein